MLRRLSTSAVAVAALAVAGALSTPAAADPGGAPHGDPGVERQREVHEADAAQRQALVTRRAKRQAAARADDTPLSVTIDQLTPSTLPEQGRVHVSGQVTNDDTETWRTITLRPVVSLEPMVNPAQLAAAADTPPDAVIGPRINVEPFRGFVETLAPGETATYSFAVPRRLLEVSAPGVYWFGVHALGEGPDGRDALADGRARTFLPLVPAAETDRQPTAVVIPLRRQLVYADDGSVDDLAGWTKTLSDGGRLRSLVDFGAASGSSTVTWVVDPALVDAVRRLADGNPGRSLAPNLESDEDDGEDGSEGEGDGEATGSASPSPGASSEPGPSVPTEEPDTDSPLDLDSLDPVVQAAADAAQTWLTRLESATGPEDDVLTLPYGDVDVAGAVAHDPQLYQRAVARAAGGLPGLAPTATPVVASPSGYLSTAAIAATDPGSTVVVTDAMFEAPAPAVASVDGREVVVASSGAAAGGPGPDSRTGPTAMRQRLLAEAAVRLLRDEPEPLTVVLPHDWNPDSGAAYFGGLDAPWLDLAGLDEVARSATATPVAATGLRYPGWQREAELDQPGFDSATALIRAGAMLQNLLTLNNLVSGTVTDQALGSVSYSARTSPVANRLSADGARRWITQRLGRVTVSAPRAVTLSSTSGRFQATVTNGLDQPVTVALDAESDDRLLIEGPERVDVPAGGRQAVLLTARTDENGIHEVALLVTDKRGTPLGPRTELNIRSAQVSNVIWLFLAIGGALLFGAIALRIFRRIRDARRSPADAGPEPDESEADRGPSGPDGEAARQPAGAGSR